MPSVLTLGIESSCDETSCSVVKDGRIILSNVIASQADFHSAYGGVVPELASRMHEGKGVRVVFHENDDGFVSITVFPIVYYGMIIPEVAWTIQEHVKTDVERFTGLVVESVDVHAGNIRLPGDTCAIPELH